MQSVYLQLLPETDLFKEIEESLHNLHNKAYTTNLTP